MLDKSRRSRGAENCMHVGALIRWRLSVPKVKSKKTTLRQRCGWCMRNRYAAQHKSKFKFARHKVSWPHSLAAYFYQQLTPLEARAWERRLNPVEQ